jgi:hypothetical protein
LNLLAARQTPPTIFEKAVRPKENKNGQSNPPNQESKEIEDREILEELKQIKRALNDAKKNQ